MSIQVILRIAVMLSLAGLLAACGDVTKTMKPTEVGVRFRKLPLPFGGISSDIVQPGQLAFLLWPFDSIYTFDTAVKDVSWPSAVNSELNEGPRGYISTRAKDGNEVALAVTVRYRVSFDPEKLLYLIQNGATNEAAVQQLVISVARSEVRTRTNTLATASFLNREERYQAIDRVQEAMQTFFEPYGIEIDAVILDDFRFERLLDSGEVDTSYQERLTQIQKIREDTDRETARVETVRAKKQQELNNVQAGVNRQLAEANGFKKQAMLRGDAYFESKNNEAQGILALGQAEAQGLEKQIEALSGPGGHAILKLEIAKQLIKADPRFVVMDQGSSGQGVAVQRLDANQLLDQIGLLEALQPETKGKEGSKQKTTSDE